MAKRYFIVFILVFVAVFNAWSQRRLPPKKNTFQNGNVLSAAHRFFTGDVVKLLKVPSGWTVSVAASGLGKPRMMQLGPDGSLYITRRDGGDVLMLKDRDGDGKFDELTTVAAQFKGVHGIALRGNWLYLCNNTELRRYRIRSDGTLEKNWETLINDLPNAGQLRGRGRRVFDRV